MNVYKPGELAKKLNISWETIRLWAEEGKIKITKTDGGHRRYIYEENEKKCDRQKIIYVRVSSTKQEGDLKRQIEFLQKKYPGYKVISDIDSGLNYTKKRRCKTFGRNLYRNSWRYHLYHCSFLSKILWKTKI